jgi:N-acetyl-1-D-myo-inositol-2-amino-2-deoxy-alpha-D-glucopyranoside deacetylase
MRARAGKSDSADAADASRPARLLFVHAHPDDETLTTGITMATYASRGHDVHLLTCTLGEEGEVIPPALAHLAADRQNRLGLWRREELRAAMSVLGVCHLVLGEDASRGVASRYRDSGMAGTGSTAHPDAFVGADLPEAVAMVVAHIRAVRPDVVVTYDEQGGYLHPDHVQTHRVTMSALASLAAEYESEGLSAPTAFCILTPASWAVEDRDWLRDQVVPDGSNRVVLQQEGEPFPPSVVPDETVTHVVEDPALVPTQRKALACHASQVSVGEGFYALSNHIAVRLSGREGFAQFDPAAGRLLPGEPGAVRMQGLVHPRVHPQQPDLQQPDLQQPDLQQPDLQQPDLQQPDLQQPHPLHHPVAAQRKARR